MAKMTPMKQLCPDCYVHFFNMFLYVQRGSIVVHRHRPWVAVMVGGEIEHLENVASGRHLSTSKDFLE